MQAQKHQAKWYNIRNGSGEPFEIGTKVLKRCMKNLSHKQKIFRKMTGPYVITGCSSTGSYYVRDWYGHQMVHTIVPNQLVWFYENKKYKTNDKGQVVDSSMYDDCTMSDDTGSNVDTESQGQNVDTEEMGVDCSTCQHADIYVPNTN